MANSEVYLDAASTNPAYRQIVLIDGPAVLGWNSLSERGDGPTHQIADYLRDAVDEGVLEPQPLEPLAHLLSALGRGPPCTWPTPTTPKRPGARSAGATSASSPDWACTPPRRDR